MNQNTLNKANELQDQISEYNTIVHAMSFPYQKFGIRNRRAYVGSAGNYGIEVTIRDKDLAKLIADYCDKKRAELKAELEAL